MFPSVFAIETHIGKWLISFIHVEIEFFFTEPKQIRFMQVLGYNI